MCKSSTPREISTPSPQEQQIQSTQLQQMQLSQEYQKELEPYTLSGMGLMRDPSTGKIREMTDEEYRAGLRPLQATQYDIAQLQQQRQLAALKGELPVDPGMMKRLDDEEKKLREYLSQTLGPNYEQSTSGIQALNNFNTQKQSLIYQAQQGEMTSGEAGLLANLGYLGSYQAGAESAYGNLPQAPMALAQQYGGLLDPYYRNRALKGQLMAAMRGQQASNWNSGMSMAGSIA